MFGFKSIVVFCCGNCVCMFGLMSFKVKYIELNVGFCENCINVKIYLKYC